MARSRFVNDIPRIIENYGRVPEYDAIEDACSQDLPELAIEGIKLFNHGEYFEAHELLEEAWIADDTVGRELFRALLQVAVAYLQIERENYNGAKKMFLRLRQWISPLPNECKGIDIKKLRVDIGLVYKELSALGSERISEFDRTLFQPILFREEQ